MGRHLFVHDFLGLYGLQVFALAAAVVSHAAKLAAIPGIAPPKSVPASLGRVTHFLRGVAVRFCKMGLKCVKSKDFGGPWGYNSL